MQRSPARSAVKRVVGEAHCDKLRTMRRSERRPVFGLKYSFMNIIRDPQLSHVGNYHGTDKGDESHTSMELSALGV